MKNKIKININIKYNSYNLNIVRNGKHNKKYRIY